MRTQVSDSFFLSGDEITEKPQNGTLCFRCGESIGHEEKCGKLANLIVENDKLIIHWNWFCGGCFKKINKLIKNA